jgi:hypothetical protein
MLFFSISHAYPFILMVVVFSALFFVILALLNILCVLIPALRAVAQLVKTPA